MKRPVIGLVVAALLASVVSAQAPQGKTFDAADVRPRARGSNPNPQWSGGVLRGGRYDVRNATMVDLIALAYGVENGRVLGGPNWLESDRFDVVAKAPQATTTDDLHLMLQALLAERFKLAVHNDQKSQPGFALVQNGKHKMREATDPSKPGFCEPLPQPPPAPGVTPLNYASCTSITMEAFVQQMRNMAAAYFSGPVIDATGLKGKWDFDLKWTQRAILAQAGADGISMFDAVDKQVGLKLEPRAVTVPVLLVDAVNEKPTENAADVAKVLPPAPPSEFEVAVIKVSPPDQLQPMGRFQPGGRVDVQGFTLKMLLTLAWDVNDDELIAGLPKWADDTRYNITARAAVPALDIDDMRLMMQALLIDKFKLKTHTEERPVTAYALVSTGSPKLAKADPVNRTTWKNGVPAAGARDPRDSNPIISRLVTCQNMSMTQLADALPRMAPGYIRTPVVDATGIQGNFDFSFFFTPNGVGGIGGGSARGADAAPAPSSAAMPSGAVSLYDAFTRQLGLKLEVQKRPLPVLVIDSVEQKPVDD